MTDRRWSITEMAGRAFTLDDIISASRALRGHDFRAFGVKNSESYMKLLLEIWARMGVSADVQAATIIMSGTVMNKKKFLEGMNNMSSSFMNKQEIIKAVSFMRPAAQSDISLGIFPFTNITSSFPNLAFVGSIITMDENPMKFPITSMNMGTFPKAFQRNFTGQLNLNTVAQDFHKLWAKNFWDNIVKKPKAATAYEKGFQASYYENAVNDKYELVMFTGMNEDLYTTPYSLRQILIYITEVWHSVHNNAPFYDDYDDDCHPRGDPRPGTGKKAPPPPPSKTSTTPTPRTPRTPRSTSKPVEYNDDWMDEAFSD
jgi:hypothetical protein